MLLVIILSILPTPFYERDLMMVGAKVSCISASSSSSFTFLRSARMPALLNQQNGKVLSQQLQPLVLNGIITPMVYCDVCVQVIGVSWRIHSQQKFGRTSGACPRHLQCGHVPGGDGEAVSESKSGRLVSSGHSLRKAFWPSKSNHNHKQL